jgi:GNAT superfamily N-acetyltransferase
MLGQEPIGFVEVETVEEGERRSRHGGLTSATSGWPSRTAARAYRRQGVATWLLGQAANWLRLTQVDRLLDYAWLQGTDPGGLYYAGYRASSQPPVSGRSPAPDADGAG